MPKFDGGVRERGGGGVARTTTEIEGAPRRPGAGENTGHRTDTVPTESWRRVAHRYAMPGTSNGDIRHGAAIRHSDSVRVRTYMEEQIDK